MDEIDDVDDTSCVKHSIKHSDAKIVELNPIAGSSYMELPLKIRYKRVIINVKNDDGIHFK